MSFSLIGRHVQTSADDPPPYLLRTVLFMPSSAPQAKGLSSMKSLSLNGTTGHLRPGFPQAAPLLDSEVRAGAQAFDRRESPQVLSSRLIQP